MTDVDIWFPDDSSCNYKDLMNKEGEITLTAVVTISMRYELALSQQQVKQL